LHARIIRILVSAVNETGVATTRWWQWPTVLSLDAPVVAVVWQEYLATLAGVAIGWPHRVVLSVSVCLAYAADRWFEGWRVAPTAMRTPRHRFYQKHRWKVATVWVFALAMDLAVAFYRLTPRELVAGTLLLIPTLLYVLSHQLLHRNHPFRLPKEMCVAALIAGGASVFVIASPAARIAVISLPLCLFVALCFANVVLIGVWEREVDESHGQVSLARQFSSARRIGRLLPWLLALTGTICLLQETSISRSATACVAVSALLLGSIDRLERRVGWKLARILADAALLTPIVPLTRAWMR
jgi:hypothetical protein